MDSSWEKLLNHEDYSIGFFGANILIKDKVFSPDPNLTYSPSILIKNIGDVNDKLIADIGTGTGAIAIVCALSGAKKVVATDISDLAIQNASYNIKHNNVEKIVELFKANLLEGVEGKFDIICANLPILDEVWDGRKIEPLEVIENFFVSASNYLTNDGKILIPWGSFAEDSRRELENLIQKYEFDFHITKEEKLGFVWYLYEIKTKPLILP